MKDNEIIKGYCKKKLCPPAQEIINSQKAEIERLEKFIESRGAVCKLCEEKYTEKMIQAIANAIKKFAEKLKEKKQIRSMSYSKKYYYIIEYVDIKDIDNLVKEIVGE